MCIRDRNIDYDMADLTTTSAEALSRYKQVWAFCTDEMDAACQQIIVDYIETGGNAVIYPYLPDRDLAQRPCTIIRDAVKVSPSGKEIIDSPLIDVLDLRDIKCSNPQFIYSKETLTGTEILARTINGSACGFVKSLGRGSLVHLGTWTGFDTEGHKPVYRAILDRAGARLSQASASDENITVRERFTTDNRAILFVANYYNEEHTGSVMYTHPGTGGRVKIPFTAENMIWPALYGILTPVGLETVPGVKILHCTSDILGVTLTGDGFEIILYGDRDLYGELVLEGGRITAVRSATVEGRVLQKTEDGERIAFTYEHIHNKEFVIKIEISR
jgi:beta-galactosidase